MLMLCTYARRTRSLPRMKQVTALSLLTCLALANACSQSAEPEVSTISSDVMTDPTWIPASGGYYGGIAATSWGPNRLDLFYVAPDHSLGHRYSNDGGTSWSSHESWGGWVSWPSAVSWGVNRIDIVAIGGDSQLYHQWYTPWHAPTPSTPWEPLGVYAIEPPAISTRGPNVLDVAWVASDRTIRHGYYSLGTGWVMNADNLGGVAASSYVASNSWGSGRVDISVIGTDGTIAHQAWDNTTGSVWSGWWATPNATGINQMPVAETSNRYQELDTWWLKNDHLMRERWTAESSWSPAADDFGTAHTGWLAAVAMPGTTSGSTSSRKTAAACFTASTRTRPAPTRAARPTSSVATRSSTAFRHVRSRPRVARATRRMPTRSPHAGPVGRRTERAPLRAAR